MLSGSTKALGTRAWRWAALVTALAVSLSVGCSSSTNGSSPGRTSTTRPSSTTATTPSSNDGTTGVTTSTPPTKSVTSTTADDTTGTAAVTAVYGTVTAGPTCPVERPDQPCPPAPVHGMVEALDRAGQIVGQAPTDGQGRYDLPVPAGMYTLHVAVGAVYPRCPDTAATAAAGRRTKVDITCDTGLR